MSSDSKSTTHTENSEICWEMILNGNMWRKCHASEKVVCGLNPFWASCFTLLIRSVGRCLESTIRIVYWLCSRTLTELSTNGWLGFTSELLRGIKEQYIKSGQQKGEQLCNLNICQLASNFLRQHFPSVCPFQKDVSKILSGPSETVSHCGAEPALAFLTVPFYRKVSVSHFRFCHTLLCPDFTLFLPRVANVNVVNYKLK